MEDVVIKTDKQKFNFRVAVIPYNNNNQVLLQRVENGLKNGGSFETEGLGRNPLLLSYFQVVMCSFQVSFM